MPRRLYTETADSVDLRIAEPRDIPGLVDLYRVFFGESTLPSLGAVFSRRHMETWLDRAVEKRAPTHIVAIEKDNRNKVLGSISYNLDRVFSTPVANLDKFYVRPEWRLSALGRMLLAGAVADAASFNAVGFRAGLSSGIAGSRNVFEKMGFREVPGSVLMERKF
jgi:GNAT superfamily N-acetyltransferase